MKKLTLQFLALVVTLIIYSGLSAQNSDFKPSGTLSGYVFGDYYWKQHSDSAGRGGKNVQYSPTQTPAAGINTNAGSTGANAFQIRRAYLTYDYDLTKKISAHATLANEQNVDGSGYNTTYLKYMFIKYADIFKGSNLFFGQMPTPSFAQTPFGTEPLWGYRSVERTILDLHNIDASSDAGIALQGSLWKAKTSNDTIKPDMFGYEIQIGNGNSAKPAVNMFKKFRGTVYTALLQQKLNVGIYADYVRSGLSSITVTGTGAGVITSTPEMESKTYKIYADYKTKAFNIGAEYFEVENANSDLYTAKNDEGVNTRYFVSGVQQGFSVWVTGKILKDLNFYARYDNYNPDSKFNNSHTYSTTFYGAMSKTNTSTYTQSFVTAGLDYTITKRIHVMPNIWYNKYESKLNASQLNGSAKLKSDYDLVPRVTFYVIFNSSKKVQNNGMDN